jgi:anti-sigma factor RsiW
MWASRIVRVHGALALLTTEAAPIGILGRANEKALRMLARTLRESETAVRLRSARPSAGLWAQIEGPVSRAAAAAAAAMIILSLRAGVANGIKQTCDLAQPLADLHYQRHIDDPKLLS